jgi:hypothetical protein
MENLLNAHKNDTIDESLLIEKTRYAKEEITKDEKPFKMVKLIYLKLSKKVLKPFTRFFLQQNPAYTCIHSIECVINDEKYIRYIQVNFLYDDTDEDSQYKPYVRFYREKTFHTIRKHSDKKDMIVNTSQEHKTPSEEMLEFKTQMFKLIYKIIFNSFPENAPKKDSSNDQYKRRIIFAS